MLLEALYPHLSVFCLVSSRHSMAFTSATSNVTSYLHRRTERVKEHVKQKKSLSGWVLPQQASTFTDEGSWSNIDADVTPLDRRTWSTWTVLGFWFSDALNAQGWEGAASFRRRAHMVGVPDRLSIPFLRLFYPSSEMSCFSFSTVGSHLT